MKKINIKKIVFGFFFVLISFIYTNNDVHANYDAKIVNTSPCKLKSNATGSCMYSNTTFKSLTTGTYWVDVGDDITVITSKAEVTPPKSGNGSECKSAFVYMSINYNSKTYYGYVCKDQIWDGKITDAMKTEFKNAGFPESYYEGLATMKISHPKWKFVAIDTKLKFANAVKGENYSGNALIQYTSSTGNQGYLSTAEADYNWKKDTFIAHDGSSWYQARKKVIEYMMDPRNSLSDTYIFQFETLSYIENSNNLNAIKSMLNGHYILKFAKNYLSAGKSQNVNPVYLASLSKQEIGGAKANTAIAGGKFTCNGKTYSGYYNFFNIGATSSSNPVINGLCYAAGKPDSSGKVTATSFSRPWNTTTKAIVGGAQFIANRYIRFGQSTSYFKKWNVVHNYALAHGYKETTSLYSNQYMTNVQAPRSEARSTYNSYKSLGVLDDEYTFFIPVYSDMPASTSMPKKGNPNNWLKNLTLSQNDGTATKITGFSGDIFNYEIHVPYATSKANIAATTINSNASVTGAGVKNLTVGNNSWSIVVKAQNGEKKTYTVNVIRDASKEPIKKTVAEVIKESSLNTDGTYLTGLTLNTTIDSIKNELNKIDTSTTIKITSGGKEITSGNLSTGQVVTIKSNGEEKSYNVVIYGDINGDNKINALDLLKVQKHILGIGTLNGASLKSADPSKDGNINALDLLKVQKHILGIAFINQD